MTSAKPSTWPPWKQRNGQICKRKGYGAVYEWKEERKALRLVTEYDRKGRKEKKRKGNKMKGKERKLNKRRKRA